MRRNRINKQRRKKMSMRLARYRWELADPILHYYKVTLRQQQERAGIKIAPFRIPPGLFKTAEIILRDVSFD